MKLTLADPLRHWWLRAKALLTIVNPHPPDKAAPPPAPHKPHRTTAFFDLP